MNDSIPQPDPYKVLGVSKDASSNEIKSAYRKGCLRCHPDKTSDPALISEFHQIQVAYDTVGDDVARQKYDDSARLQQLRRDVFAAKRSSSDSTARPDAKSSPRPDSYVFTPRESRVYEERRPKQPTTAGDYDKDFSNGGESRPQARKYADSFESPPLRRNPSTATKPAPTSSKVPPAPKTSTKDRERAERQKQRDREKMRERKYRFESVDNDSSDDNSPYATAERLRRDRSEQEHEERVRQASRSDSDRDRDARSRKMSYTTADARDYINSRSGRESSDRSAAFRQDSTSMRTDSKSSRPAFTRTRASTTTKVREPSPPPSPRRSGYRVVDPPLDRSVPGMYSSKSSPSDIKIPSGGTTRRAYTYNDQEDFAPNAPKPSMSRSETMPVRPPPVTRRTTSTRRQDSLPVQSSNLRHAETTDSGYASNKGYSVRTDAAGDSYEHETVLREPGRMRRSPSPVRRRSSSNAGATKFVPVEKERGRERSGAAPPSSFKMSMDSSPQPTSRRPSLGRSGSTSSRVPSMQRGQTMPSRIKTGNDFYASGSLFGEISTSPVDATRDFPIRKDSGSGSSARRVGRETLDNVLRRPSYTNEHVSYSSMREPESRRSPLSARYEAAY